MRSFCLPSKGMAIRFISALAQIVPVMPVPRATRVDAGLTSDVPDHSGVPTARKHSSH